MRSTTKHYCSRACKREGQWVDPLGRTHNGRPVRLDAFGYVLIYEPTHPRADQQGRISEHRWVMEQHLGRLLQPDEAVHHVNEIKHDNRIDNLQVMLQRDHMRLHMRERNEAARANAATVAAQAAQISEQTQTIATQREQIAWLQDALAIAERGGASLAPDHSVASSAPTDFTLSVRCAADWLAQRNPAMVPLLAQLLADERRERGHV